MTLPKLSRTQWLLVAVGIVVALALLWQLGVKKLNDTVQHSRECGYRKDTTYDCKYGG
jgi:hypothetical protein